MKPCGYCDMCLSGNEHLCYNVEYHEKYSSKKKKKVSHKTASFYKEKGQEDLFDKGKPHVKCAHTHPPLKITDKITVYGGAASDPIHAGLDIYLSLDYGKSHDKCMYPWHEVTKQFVYFPITDMAAPKDPEEFKLMINWLAAQAEAGKSIHIGCIGGHGRTGTVLAALVNKLTGNADAIQFVRDNYCKKAVESKDQVNFLHEHYGITKRDPSKTYSYGGYKGGAYDNTHVSSSTTLKGNWSGSLYGGNYSSRHKKYAEFSDDVIHPVPPMTIKGTIWGD